MKTKPACWLVFNEGASGVGEVHRSPEEDRQLDLDLNDCYPYGYWSESLENFDNNLR